jgi:transposase-like protein
MKPSRFTDEQIIGILREQEAGAATADVCRKHGISSATFYKWKAKYGGLELSDAKRLRALEDENVKLKKLLAAAMLDNAMLKDVASKKMVTPAAKREAVAHLRTTFEVSERRACKALGADRTSVRYRSRRADDAVVRARLSELAAVRRRFGYRRLLVLMLREGLVMNHKGAAGDPARRQPALEPGLSVGCVRRWSTVPDSGRGRRLHPRMPGARRRYLAAGPAGRTRTRCHHRLARPAGDVPVRQRH